MSETISGDGYAVSSLDALGEGPGFRKVRGPLGVQAFGINAIVLPPGYATPKHSHERQEETYFVHRGTLEIEFGDGTKHTLGPGGLARGGRSRTSSGTAPNPRVARAGSPGSTPGRGPGLPTTARTRRPTSASAA